METFLLVLVPLSPPHPPFSPSPRKEASLHTISTSCCVFVRKGFLPQFSWWEPLSRRWWALTFYCNWAPAQLEFEGTGEPRDVFASVLHYLFGVAPETNLESESIRSWVNESENRLAANLLPSAAVLGELREWRRLDPQEQQRSATGKGFGLNLKPPPRRKWTALCLTSENSAVGLVTVDSVSTLSPFSAVERTHSWWQDLPTERKRDNSKNSPRRDPT